MKLSIRLFAAARQSVGRDSVDIELPDDATVGQLRQYLTKEFPELSALIRQSMFSINAEYAGDGQTIPADAEVACIPPVSGG